MPFFKAVNALVANPTALAMVNGSIVNLHHFKKLVSQNARTLAIINQVNLSHLEE